MNAHKVKFFSARYPSDLESKINNFLNEGKYTRKLINVSYAFSPRTRYGRL